MIRDITLGQYYPVDSVLHRHGSEDEAVWNAGVHCFICFSQTAFLCYAVATVFLVDSHPHASKRTVFFHGART